MYCPPAGGYTDEDHKQCIDKNTSAFNDCTKSCAPPADQQSPTTPSPSQPVEQPVTTDKPY